MTEQSTERSSELCLTLLCATSIEEKLLDFLLMSEDVLLFTSTKSAAHGVKGDDFNSAEQVLGRVSMTQIQVFLAAHHLQTLQDTIQQQFAGTGVRYWVTSLIATGELS